MNKGSTAANGTACAARASGSNDKCSQMSKKVSNANHVSHTTQNGDFNKRQGPGHVRTLSQELREHPLLITSASSLTPRSHQRRWSADFCQCGTSPAITVKKTMKEPMPPQRGVSLLRLHTASRSSSKRHSCPPPEILRSPIHSSSSSSSISSCSSPPPVKTSDITGPDPLGWKLRPRNSSSSSSTSRQARTKRLSLQIPLPIILPDHKSSPDPQLDPTTKPKPALKAKPFRRRHSESSAFLRSLANPVPVVTLEELCNVHLRSVTYVNESDDVFNEGNDEEEQKEEKVTTQPCKTPPPVAEKTAMARQIAQLIAHSRQRQRRWPVTAKTNQEEHIYTSEIQPEPKHSHQTEDHHSLHATKTGLRLDTSYDRERTTPRFLAEDSKRQEIETPSNSNTINYRGD